MVHAQILRGKSFAAVHAAIPVPGKDLQPFHAFRPTCCTPHSFPDFVDLPDRGRRKLFDQLTRFLNTEESVSTPHDVPPRLTFQALESIRMSRSRERILTNLEEMYREAFDRAKETGDPAQMASLDFAYRREQLYFEILLDVRDAVEKR